MKLTYYFIDPDGKQSEPVDKEYFKLNGVNPVTWIWFEGLPEWIEAREIPSLTPFISTMTPESFSKIENNKLTKKDLEYPTKRKSKSCLKPKSWLFESILVTLLCFMPFGIVAIIYSSRISILWKHEKYAEAIENTYKARIWIRWSIFTLLMILVALLFVMYVTPELMEIDYINESYHFNL
ncbi:MAG: CD225/dispanin family protein [Bacteroidetes bacterium]|nr:CD225/dispanin family protein [Bacteroidota bacterium]